MIQYLKIKWSPWIYAAAVVGLACFCVLKHREIITLEPRVAVAKVVLNDRDALAKKYFQSVSKFYRPSDAKFNLQTREIVSGYWPQSYETSNHQPTEDAFDTKEFLSEDVSTIFMVDYQEVAIFSAEKGIELELLVTFFALPPGEAMNFQEQFWASSTNHRVVLPVEPLVWNKIALKHHVSKLVALSITDGEPKVLAEFPVGGQQGGGQVSMLEYFYGIPASDENGVWFPEKKVASFGYKLNENETTKTGYAVSVIGKKTLEK